MRLWVFRWQMMRPDPQQAGSKWVCCCESLIQLLIQWVLLWMSLVFSHTCPSLHASTKLVFVRSKSPSARTRCIELTEDFSGTGRHNINITNTQTSDFGVIPFSRCCTGLLIFSLVYSCDLFILFWKSVIDINDLKLFNLSGPTRKNKAARKAVMAHNVNCPTAWHLRANPSYGLMKKLE